jgi:hypothetical protein
MFPLRLCGAVLTPEVKIKKLLVCSLLTRCRSLLPWGPYLYRGLTSYDTLQSGKWLTVFQGYVRPSSSTCKGASLRK